MRNLALAFFVATTTLSQTFSYRLSVLLPIDPINTLGYANGLLSRTANWAQVDTLAPGSFMGVSVLSVVSSTTFAYVCGMDPSNTTILLRPADGISVPVPLIRRPPNFGADPPAGCDFVTGIVPRDLPLGPAELSFAFRDIRITSQVRIAASYAALFTPLDLKLTGPYLSGDTVSLRANGLGPVPLEELSLVAGGVRTPATSIDPDPDVPGLDRVSFVMPAEAPETCYLPVYLTTSTGETSAVFIPKANQPSPCRHPWGLDANALTTLDQPGGRIWLAQPTISLYARERSVTVSAAFNNADIWRTQLFASPEDTRPCRFRQGVELAVTQTYLSTTFGDAGPTLAIAPPNGLPRTLSPTLLTYFNRFDPESPAGEWTLTGPGGPAIGVFQSTVAIPPMPLWTPPGSIDRETGLDITWDPDSVSESDRLAVILQTLTGTYLECRAAAKSGTLQLPPRYLRALAPSSQGVVGIIVSRPFNRHARFSFPTPNSGTGTGVLDYQLIAVAPVPVQ